MLFAPLYSHIHHPIRSPFVPFFTNLHTIIIIYYYYYVYGLALSVFEF